MGVFDRTGRHLAERDAVSGAELRRFDYDAALDLAAETLTTADGSA